MTYSGSADPHLRKTIDDLTDLVGGHVLALPTEGVAHPIDELATGIAEGKTGFDLLHEIAGVEPGIAVFKRRRLGTFSCSSCPPFTKTLPTFWWTSNQGMFTMLGSMG